MLLILILILLQVFMVHLSFNVSGGSDAAVPPWAVPSFFMPRFVTFVVTSPRFFLMLSMPREVGPRLLH